jgi:hypothetical protein
MHHFHDSAGFLFLILTVIAVVAVLAVSAKGDK